MESLGGGCLEPEEVPFVVCYPRESCELVNALKTLGIKVCNFGRREIRKFKVLGVGFRGVVFKGLWKGMEVAVKVPRADRNVDMSREGSILKLIENLKVAPKPFYWDKRVLVMELILGKELVDVISQKPYYACKTLCAARSLDRVGVDHGELVRLEEHALVVNDRVKFVDFGSASTKRKPRNVTAVASALFLKPTELARRISNALSVKKVELIEALKVYKKKMDEESFERVLSATKCPPCDVH